MSGITMLLATAGARLTSATATPAALVSGATSSTFTTATTTAIPSGGTGPFTYAWTVVSSDTSLSILSPASAASAFALSGIPAGQTVMAIVRCTVTDTSDASSKTVDVPINHTDRRPL